LAPPQQRGTHAGRHTDGQIHPVVCDLDTDLIVLST
jgi:hypothetical protein